MTSRAPRAGEHRRTVIADAVLAVLGRAGSRGLTHRAVDAAAGLPEGSASYYFRTREALLVAAAARLAERDLAAAARGAQLAAPPDGPPHGTDRVDALAALLAGLVQAQIAQREDTLARYELSLEGVRSPSVAAALNALGERFVDAAVALLEAAGAGDPHGAARAVIAAGAGLVYESVVGAQVAYSTAEIHAVLRDVLLARLA